MRVLVAFDKFKGSLTASAACEIAAAALREAQPSWTVDSCPLADGGDGFASILTAAAGGELRRCRVTGPRGEAVDAAYGLVDVAKIPAAARARLGSAATDGARIAVIEMSAASGLALLPPERRDVWQTSTIGTGELIAAAARDGASAVVLGVGGSATNELGLGALQVLGAKYLGLDNLPLNVAPAPVSWPQIRRIAGELDALPPIFIACDVTNPLLGPQGAAAVYGPQKGLRRADVARLDHESARLALLLCTHFGQPDTTMEQPGTGAAGGIAFGLMVATGARLLPGFDLVAQWLNVDGRIAAADIVVTGEGRFDDSSLTGKGPGAIAARALAGGKRVHVFAGTVTAAPQDAALGAHAINPPGVPLADAIRDTEANLARSVRRVFVNA